MLLDSGMTVIVDRWMTSYNVYGKTRAPLQHVDMYDRIHLEQKTLIYQRCDPQEAYDRVAKRDGHSRYTVD